MNDGLLGFPRGIQILTQPQWTNIGVVGTNLQATWTPVAQAVVYELLTNSAPTEVGASVLARVVGNSVVQALNQSSVGNLTLLNPDFESGDLIGWNLKCPMSITTSSPHGGTYALSYNGNGLLSNLPFAVSNDYPIVASASYVASAWMILTTLVDANDSIKPRVNWKDANKTTISFGEFGSYGNPDSVWRQYAATLTAPANAAYASLEVWFSSIVYNLQPVAFKVDDFAMAGPTPAQDTKFYAVRGYDANGNVTPTSSWVKPVQSAAALGNPTGSHAQIDYPTATIKSSNFVPGATGYSISPNGIDGRMTGGDGWISDAATWTYASATTFTISGDVRTKFPKGAKIKLTQTTVKYFYVINATYSAPNTTITVAAGSDYSLANAAITSPAYSYAEIPQGFPEWFNYNCTWGVDTAPLPSIGNGTFTAVFKLQGTLVTFWIRLSCGSTTTYGGAGTYYFTVPIAQSSMADGLSHGMMSGFAHRPGVWLVQMMHYWFNPTSFNAMYWTAAGDLVFFGAAAPGLGSGAQVRMTGQYRIW
ncbi:MAG: hypothetical protein HY868_25605 [Chloroflexi bacterium]|nr:hypothetical protein [Chloroflexota bacterium]